MLRTKQFLAIARLTALEAVRQPVCILLAVTCVMLTALVPLLLVHNFGEEGRLVRDGGLAFHLVFGLFLTGNAAVSSLARERESGTLCAVLSKPVDRVLFFFAKFAGIALVVIAFSICASLSVLLSERAAEHYIMGRTGMRPVSDSRTALLLLTAPVAACGLAGLLNYLLRRPFESTAFALLIVALAAVFVTSGFFDQDGQRADFGFRVQWRILPASVLVCAALLVLAAWALAFSARLSPGPALVLCGGVFLLGLLSDFLFRGAESLPARVLYSLVPNWQHFWVADGLGGGGVVPRDYVLSALAYAAAYAGAVLCLGAWLFKRTEPS